MAPIRSFGRTESLVSPRGLDCPSGISDAAYSRAFRDPDGFEYCPIKSTGNGLQSGGFGARHAGRRSGHDARLKAPTRTRRLSSPHAIDPGRGRAEARVFFLCLLTRGEDYAHTQPSLTAKKLRKLELLADAERYERSATGIYSAHETMRQAERALARQAEASYERMVRDSQASGPKEKVGASATPEHA
jgi:hypothetical protein